MAQVKPMDVPKPTPAEGALDALEYSPTLRIKVPDNVPCGIPERQIRSLDLKRFLCGVVAGGAAGAASSPLGTIRTRVIARKGAQSTVEMLGRVAKDEGVRRGVLKASLETSIVMTGITRGIQFYVYEVVKRAAQRRRGHDPKVLPLPSALPLSSLAGAAGAFSSTLATYPRSAIGDHMSLQPGKYASMRDAFVGIAREHGALQVFRGVVPKLISMVPAGAINFYTFDALKERVQRREKRDITTVESLAFGAVAGMASTLATYPFELARREINMSLLPRSATPTGGYKNYNNLVQAMTGIARSHGAPGLYRGVVASLLEVAPTTAITFMVYEAAKRVFVAENQERLEEVKG